jgi:hypothetical protein
MAAILQASNWAQTLQKSMVQVSQAAKEDIQRTLDVCMIWHSNLSDNSWHKGWAGVICDALRAASSFAILFNPSVLEPVGKGGDFLFGGIGQLSSAYFDSNRWLYEGELHQAKQRLEIAQENKREVQAAIQKVEDTVLEIMRTSAKAVSVT